MTPTEQDKNPSNSTPLDDELREQLKFNILLPFATKLDPLYRAEMLFDNGALVDTSTVYELAIDKIFKLITADRKRVALEARIDELQKYLDHYKDDYDRYADSRIAELKAQQEEV